ncbi:MAG TPA: S-methyl-5'-thioadenosine phosphorylase [Gaiellales bacterium]
MIGIIGGSGLYELFEPQRTAEPETPYGRASAPIALGSIGGVAAAFLPRHGLRHELPPHRVPYRANLWALRSVGVTRIVAPYAVGSLRADLPPGSFVLPDQFVDRTSGREHTYFDGPDVRHVSAADPYCADLRACLLAAGREHDLPMRDGGTVVVVEGPRFSTRAESAWYRAMGWDLVNMTAYPEGWLARELGLCFANVSLVTDFDVGVEGEAHAAVTAATVLEAFAANIERLRLLLASAVARIGEPPPGDACGQALEGAAT